MAEVEIAESPDAAVIVKLTLLMSKNIFPAASTFILAVVVALLGTVMFSVPSFAVLASSTVGKVFPPSVERDILTLAQFIGAPLVPLTFHVTVCVEPPAQVTAVFGAVTVNAPPVFATVSV